MRKLLLLFVLLYNISIPVQAAELEPPGIPETAADYMPVETESFGEGLWYVVKYAISKLQPAMNQSAGICLAVISAVILGSMFENTPGNTGTVSDLVCSLAIGVIFLKPTQALVTLGTDTVTTLHEYGKLLLPVMASALAAQGGFTSSTALYTGTALFSTILTSVIARLIVPLLYIYLVLSLANSAVGEDILKQMRDFTKWLMTWGLKILLYVFTGYLAITGVISGTADASAVKATKLAISGVVPVVGNILSDASETILVSAGIMKNSAGIYGLLAITAVWIGPFLQIGCQYLLTKLTAAISHVIGTKKTSTLVGNFASAMGMILAMTGTVCLLLLVSTVCFMKGIG